MYFTDCGVLEPTLDELEVEKDGAVALSVGLCAGGSGSATIWHLLARCGVTRPAVATAACARSRAPWARSLRRLNTDLLPFVFLNTALAFKNVAGTPSTPPRTHIPIPTTADPISGG